MSVHATNYIDAAVYTAVISNCISGHDNCTSTCNFTQPPTFLNSLTHGVNYHHSRSCPRVRLVWKVVTLQRSSLIPRPSSFIRHAEWSGRPGIASHMTWRKDRKAGRKAIIVHGHYHLRLAARPCISQRLQWPAPRLVNGPRDKARLGSIPDVSWALEVRIQ